MKMQSVFRDAEYFLDYNDTVRETWSIIRKQVNFKNSYFYNPIIFGNNWLSMY